MVHFAPPDVYFRLSCSELVTNEIALINNRVAAFSSLTLIQIFVIHSYVAFRSTFRLYIRSIAFSVNYI